MTRFLRLKEVQARTGLSRSSIFARMATGRFPKSVPLDSPNASAWIESEVEEWCRERIRASRGAEQPLEPTAA